MKILVLLCLLICTYSYKTYSQTFSAAYLYAIDIEVVKYLNDINLKQSEIICENLLQYNSILRDLIAGFKKREPKTITIIQDVWVKGEPKFIDQFSTKELREKFHTDFNIGNLVELLDIAKTQWIDLKTECEKNIKLCEPDESNSTNQ